MPDDAPTTTPNRPRKRIRTLRELSDVMREPRTLVIPLEDGSDLELLIRGLSAKESYQVDSIVAPVAPMKLKANHRNQPEPDGPDLENPEYVKAYGVYRRKVRTQIIALGLVGMEIEGDTLEAKEAWLTDNLPLRALYLLEDKIRALSASQIELANFALPNGSPASQS